MDDIELDTNISSVPTQNDSSTNILYFILKLILGTVLITVVIYGISFLYGQYQFYSIQSKTKTIVENDEIIPSPTIRPIQNNQTIPKEEVFNISSNVFTYSEAEPVCKAFNSKLASLREVKEAHQSGANWCNYGWSEDQMALFPIQQSYYDQLQKGPEKQRMVCGRPGINGGFFADDQLRFGINCYGKKPLQRDIDRYFQKAMQENRFVDDEEEKTEQQLFEEKVQKQVEDNKDSIIILPFNNSNWSVLTTNYNQ